MESFFDDLKKEYKKGFYVQISKEIQDLKPSMQYIGSYVRRPPLSEVRIINYTGDYVTFEYKDYYHQGSKVLHTLRTFKFIHKLILCQKIVVGIQFAVAKKIFSIFAST